jgi:hypothetical protein
MEIHQVEIWAIRDHFRKIPAINIYSRNSSLNGHECLDDAILQLF